MAGTKQTPIRLNEADRAALKRVIEHYGYRDAASLIRWLIHREDRKIAQEAGSTLPTPPAQTPPSTEEWKDLPPDED